MLPGIIMPAGLARKLAGGAPSWTTTFIQTFNLNDLPYNGATLRAVITGARLSVSGSSLRVTVESGNSGGFVLQELWVGEQAASGDTYDMKASGPTPAQILFSGSPSLTIGASTQRVSDTLVFAIDETKTYVFSAQFNGTSTLGAASCTGTFDFYKYSTAEAGVADAASGYSGGSGFVSLITKIEVLP